MAEGEGGSGRMTTVKPSGARYMYESYESSSVSMSKIQNLWDPADAKLAVILSHVRWRI